MLSQSRRIPIDAQCGSWFSNDDTACGRISYMSDICQYHLLLLLLLFFNLEMAKLMIHVYMYLYSSFDQKSNKQQFIAAI